jgi:glycosyltransferase involved in cell wall biosynthesis
MPEFFAQSALYYQPNDPQDLARKILETINASAKQQEIWCSEALAQATHFSWPDTARMTIQQLELAVSEATGRGLRKG